MGETEEKPEVKGERIAKVLARAGVASRREVERMIAAGRVALAGTILTTPAVLVDGLAGITVDGRPVAPAMSARLWRYHKPPGLITSHRDTRGRATVFDQLPKHLPRVISVGRLDLASEGLLLLTNDGGLARWMSLPSTGWTRRYRVRVHGRIDEEALAGLAEGIEIAGIRYGPITAEIERASGSNAWLRMTLKEGKNREIRRVLAALGLAVNRLIRTGYGPFTLGSLPRGGIAEVPLKALLGAAADYFRTERPSVAVERRTQPDPSKWAKAKPKPPRPGARRRQARKKT
ncbi:MAG: rRNA pseudouridine synthase [Alphaproteobacteria bacterium]|nr:MAG: rRNA pseudouridine synthase [Alphaproteobacteria bacterium]